MANQTRRGPGPFKPDVEPVFPLNRKPPVFSTQTPSPPFPRPQERRSFQERRVVTDRRVTYDRRSTRERWAGSGAPATANHAPSNVEVPSNDFENVPPSGVHDVAPNRSGAVDGRGVAPLPRGDFARGGARPFRPVPPTYDGVRPVPPSYDGVRPVPPRYDGGSPDFERYDVEPSLSYEAQTEEEEDDDEELEGFVVPRRVRAREVIWRLFGVLALGGVVYGSGVMLSNPHARREVLDWVTLGHADSATQKAHEIRSTVEKMIRGDER